MRGLPRIFIYGENSMSRFLDFIPFRKRRKELSSIVWIKILLFFVILIGIVLSLLVFLGFLEEYRYDFLDPAWVELIGVSPQDEDEVSPKTIWDLFQILAIPALLAAGTAFLNQSFTELEKRREHSRSKDIRFQEYLKVMESLVLHNNLQKSEKGDPVWGLAQGYTREVIKDLDGRWLGALLDLLDTAGLDLAARNEPLLQLNSLVFTKGDFKNRKFTNMNLSAVIVRESNWTNSVCRNVDFSNADFRKSNFTGAEFYDCDFRNVLFRHANLTRVRFDNCNLEGTHFENANLKGAKFPNTGVNIIYYDALTRIDEKLAQVLYLFSNKGNNRKLTGVDLSELVLEKIWLQGASLEKADFSHSDLRGANLRDTNLKGAIFYNTLLDKADLSGADLTHADLRRASLRNIRIDERTQIAKKWQVVSGLVSYDDIEIPDEIDFDEADLAEADLSGRDLTGKSFIGADLSFSNLDGANLTNCIFSGPGLETVKDYDDIPSHSFESVIAIGWFRSRLPRFLSIISPKLQPLQTRQMKDKNEFVTTSLEWSSLKNTNLEGAIFGNSEMDFCTINHSQINQKTDIPDKWKLVNQIFENEEEERILVGVDLSFVNLEGASLKKADLRYADLTFAVLSSADLRFAKLSEASLRGAELEGTDLLGANLENCLISESQFRQAKNYELAYTKNVMWVKEELNDLSQIHSTL
jgi:uncharacterized protein YjbI with pentapeptide repeats